MNLRNKNLLIFCGSKNGHDPVYREQMIKLTDLVSENQAAVVFGGSDMGLMHTLCEEAAKRQVPITGIIPEGLYQRGIAFTGCTELILSKSLSERKAMMEERAHAVLCFPGGIGSLDEFMHALAGKQIGESDLPLILLNLNGYYSKLLELIDFFIEEGFASKKMYEKFYVADTVEAAFDWLNAL